MCKNVVKPIVEDIKYSEVRYYVRKNFNVSEDGPECRVEYLVEIPLSAIYVKNIVEEYRYYREAPNYDTHSSISLKDIIIEYLDAHGFTEHGKICFYDGTLLDMESEECDDEEQFKKFAERVANMPFMTVTNSHGDWITEYLGISQCKKVPKSIRDFERSVYKVDMPSKQFVVDILNTSFADIMFSGSEDNPILASYHEYQESCYYDGFNESFDGGVCSRTGIESLMKAGIKKLYELGNAGQRIRAGFAEKELSKLVATLEILKRTTIE